LHRTAVARIFDEICTFVKRERKYSFTWAINCAIEAEKWKKTGGKKRASQRERKRETRESCLLCYIEGKIVEHCIRAREISVLSNVFFLRPLVQICSFERVHSRWLCSFPFSTRYLYFALTYTEFYPFFFFVRTLSPRDSQRNRKSEKKTGKHKQF